MKRSNILEARRSRVSQEARDIVDFSFRISDRIYEVLASKGLTQKDLARMLGKNESEISKWMRGTHNFTIGTLLSIERVLGEPIVEVSKKNNEESTFVPVPLLFPVFSHRHRHLQEDNLFSRLRCRAQHRRKLQ